MEFFITKRDALILRPYEPTPTKKLVKMLVQKYQGKLETLKIIRQENIKDLMENGSP
jgi:hypothetical protein